MKTVYSNNRKWYASFSFTTPPPKDPTNLTVSNVYFTNATLEWEAPVAEYPITGYAYQYKEAGDTEWSAEALTTATSVTIPGLSPDTDYDFRVKAIYSVGESSFVPVSFMTSTTTIYSYTQDWETGYNGWTVVNPDDLTGFARSSDIENFSHSGDYCFEFKAREDQTLQYLISPEFDSDTELSMSFYMRTWDATIHRHFRLGYSTTTTDLAAFTWSSESFDIHCKDWQQYVWNGCPLGAKYYAIMYTSAFGYLFIDDISFTGPVALIDDYDNSSTITTYADGQMYNAKLHGRTLYRDGDWNTLCLPFDVTDGDADDGISFSKTPLEGATVMTLGSSDFTDGTLTLNFTETTSIEAGRPYIVKWPDGASLTINSDADWLSFAQRVEAGETFAGKNVLLGADINVSTMVGSADHPFCGTFDGAGHTLNLSIDAPGVLCAAPFRYISNATIRNIVTTGSVHGGQHSAGLVGAATGSTNSIRDCLMAATVTTTQQYIGGILGHGTTSATTISNCYLTGSLTAKNVGIFYGWGDNGTHTVADCWAMGDYDATGDLNLLLSNGGTTSVTNCNRNINDDRVTQGNYTLIVFSYSPVTELLGSQWSLDGDGHVTLSPTAGVLTPELRNPLFRNAVFSDAEPTAVTSQDGRVMFVGNYDPFVIDDSNIDEIIYLGSNNTIGYASAPRTLRAFRAHFVVSAGSANHAAIRQVFFNDGTTTAVIPIAVDVKDAAAAEGWYTIQGVKLNSVPTEKGLYIHNGSKVSIK